MKIKYIKINGYKNLDFEMNFPDDGVALLIGNNGSGKSNVLEAISKIFGFYYSDILQKKHKEQIKNYINFEYEIKYEKDGTEIILNNMTTKIGKTFLPIKIYTIYSGEDLKLWKYSYFPFYENYIRKIKNMSTTDLPFIYLNKYFWEIAVLILLKSDINLEQYKINSLKNITFTFNNNLFKPNIKDNKIVVFAKKLSNGKNTRSFTFEEFYDIEESREELFELLMSAYLPDKDLKTFKFIDKIELNFENSINIFDLSEGEKKIILLKLLFEVLMDTESILLLDEPDDNIHPANKKEIKNLIDKFYGIEKNIILTTHSPTLTHFFDKNNIFMIEQGKIINQEKKEIIEFLTDNNWTYQDINIVFSSFKDIFLVEGKTDELFLQTALNIFKEDEYFKNLEFDYISVGGASGMKLFLEKFKTNSQRKVFALLDADYAGNKILKEFLTEDKINQLKEKGFFIDDDFILIYLPKPDFISNSQYEIEDLFPNDIKKELAEQGWKEKNKNWQGTIKTIPKIDKDSVKESIKIEVQKFIHNSDDTKIKREHFKEFKKIFEIIEQIKNESN